MSALRRQEGLTLVEVLLAAGLMLVVMTATIAVFASMERGVHDNQALNVDQLRARVSTDTLVRRLRNAANPDPTPITVAGAGTQVQQPLVRAQAQDLIFRTVRSDGAATTGNPQNVQLYRYCLSQGERRLYAQRLTSTSGIPAAPTTTACPGAGWPADLQQIVAADVSNGERPAFRYLTSPLAGSYTEQDALAAADFPTAIGIRTQLWLDADATRPPGETHLTSRVFLRNQNRPPVAALNVAVTGTRVVLNASTSVDPENGALAYRFADGSFSIPAQSPACNVTTSPALSTCGWGSSAVYTLRPAIGTHSFWVQIRDAGRIVAESARTTVTCTGTICL